MLSLCVLFHVNLPSVEVWVNESRQISFARIRCFGALPAVAFRIGYTHETALAALHVTLSVTDNSFTPRAQYQGYMPQLYSEKSKFYHVTSKADYGSFAAMGGGSNQHHHWPPTF